MNADFFADLRLIRSDKLQESAYESMVNTVVIAGPGSGKTRVLALKAISLVTSQIVAPAGLACISYSRETVRELKSRLKQYGFTPSKRDFVGTVHSFSLLHVIQPFGHLYPQYGIKYPIRIIPDEIADTIYNEVLAELRIADPWTIPFTEIQKHRSLSISGRSLVNITSPDLIGSAASIYERLLSNTEYLDFVGIINLSAKLIREQDFVRSALQSRFPWLLVDEYQDLGKALHEMVVELVFNANIKIYAVGDENQSIYGFNGGYPDFLRELSEYDDIRTIRLSSNYRSTQHIINGSLAALELPPPHPVYTAKRRSDESADFVFITCEREMEEQYLLVASKIIPKFIENGISLNEIAIIVGKRNQVSAMANFLNDYKIPFFAANWSFENSAVVSWILDCAAWCCSATKQPFENLFRFWKKLLRGHEDHRSAIRNIEMKVRFYEVLSEAKKLISAIHWIKFILKELALNELLKGSHTYPNEVDNIQLLVEDIERRNLKGASTEKLAKLNTPENEITITTRHSSKGLEFEVVILLGMEEGNFPDYRILNNEVAMAEAKRLCYVCISRAKRTCVLLRSQRYNIRKRDGTIWDKPFGPSRFWSILHRQFSNESNQFTSDTYI